MKFLDPAGGKFLGALALGAGPVASVGQVQLEVHATRGGLFIQNGNEMLSVRPSVETGAAADNSLPSGSGERI